MTIRVPPVHGVYRPLPGLIPSQKQRGCPQCMDRRALSRWARGDEHIQPLAHSQTWYARKYSRAGQNDKNYVGINENLTAWSSGHTTVQGALCTSQLEAHSNKVEISARVAMISPFEPNFAAENNIPQRKMWGICRIAGYFLAISGGVPPRLISHASLAASCTRCLGLAGTAHRRWILGKFYM